MTLTVCCLIMTKVFTGCTVSGDTEEQVQEDAVFFNKIDSCLSEKLLLDFYTEILSENEVLQGANSKPEFLNLFQVLNSEELLTISDSLRRGSVYEDYFWSLGKASICIQDVCSADTLNDPLLVNEVYAISTLTAYPDYRKSEEYLLNLISEVRKETFSSQSFRRYLKMEYISLFIAYNGKIKSRTLPPPED